MKKTQIYAIAIGCALIASACKKKESDDITPEPPSASNETVYTYNKTALRNSINTYDSLITVNVKDFGKGTGTITWTHDKAWILDGFVFVNEGQTLTIEPGTVVMGKAGQASDASALIVARGGKIIAEGTVNKPIVFTSVVDYLTYKDIELAGTGGRTILGSLRNNETGLWGGLILCGNAPVNNDDINLSEGGVQQQVNGIPTTEKRGLFGGTNPNDNSGILKYISVRHGGTDIGASNEINGISLAGVGSATQVDYVEAYANADDGIEIFGGNVNIKHVITAESGDEGFDFDGGWTGATQYLVTWNMLDQGCEHDGGTGTNPVKAPFGDVVVSNVTVVGSLTSTNPTTKRLMTLKSNTGIKYVNSIFCNFGKEGRLDVSPTHTSDTYRRFSNGESFIKNCIFYNIGTKTSMTGVFTSYSLKTNATATELSDAATQINTLFTDVNWANKFVDPSFQSYLTSSANFLVPTSSDASSNTFNVTTLNSFFDNVSYKGAFNPSGDNWMVGWSYLGARP